MLSGLVAQTFARVIVDPVLNGLNKCRAEGANISSLGNKPSDKPISILIGSALPRRIGMRIIQFNTLFFAESRTLHAFNIKKLTAIISGDGFKLRPELRRPYRALYTPQSFEYRGLSFVRRCRPGNSAISLMPCRLFNMISMAMRSALIKCLPRRLSVVLFSRPMFESSFWFCERLKKECISTWDLSLFQCGI